MLSPEARKKLNRCLALLRRGRVSSNDMATDFLAHLEDAGLSIVEQEPDLDELVKVLEEAGYKVEPPVIEPVPVEEPLGESRAL